MIWATPQPESRTRGRHGGATPVLAGVVGPDVPAVDVQAWHVHVGDVVAGDPETVDPWSG